MRWLFDEKWRLPFRAISTPGISEAALAPLDVLVVPNGTPRPPTTPCRRPGAGAARVGGRRRPVRRDGRRDRAGGPPPAHDGPAELSHVRRPRIADPRDHAPRSTTPRGGVDGVELLRLRQRDAVDRLVRGRGAVPGCVQPDVLRLRLRAGRRGARRDRRRGRRVVRRGPGRGVRRRAELPRVHRRNPEDPLECHLRRRSEAHPLRAGVGEPEAARAGRGRRRQRMPARWSTWTPGSC